MTEIYTQNQVTEESTINSNRKVKAVAATMALLALSMAGAAEAKTVRKSTKSSRIKRTPTTTIPLRNNTLNTTIVPGNSVVTTIKQPAETMPPVVITTTVKPSVAVPKYPIYETTKQIALNGGMYSFIDYSSIKNNDGSVGNTLQFVARCIGDDYSNNPATGSNGANTDFTNTMMGNSGAPEFIPKSSFAVKEGSRIKRITIGMDIPKVGRDGRVIDFAGVIANLIVANDIGKVCSDSYAIPTTGTMASPEYIEAVRAEITPSMNASDEFIKVGGKKLFKSVQYSGNFRLPDNGDKKYSEAGDMLKEGPAMYFSSECMTRGSIDPTIINTRQQTTTAYLAKAGISDVTGSTGLNSFWRNGPVGGMHLTYQSFPQSLAYDEVNDRLQRYSNAVDPSSFCTKPL